jgi:hypothetical protein
VNCSPPPLASFLSSFLYLLYAILIYPLPIWWYWLKQTALQWLFGEGPWVCGVWLPAADYISPRGNTSFPPDTIWYDSEFVPWHITEIGTLSMCHLWLSPPEADIR